MALFRRKQSPDEPAPDRELQDFHRAIEAAESGPPAREEGAALSTKDLESLRDWMTVRFDSMEYEAVWSKRVALGYSLAQKDAPAETWFWINALPALAALRAGERHHPLVATAAGFADEAQRSVGAQNDAVNVAMAEINERFFG